ncbi:MAG: SO_0444 family Cu/Zn efflux transporter [Abditibacteriota bacterium]|nr:SO_0444 family Cu/Zn efflux transporter [Abditibacteriota bacterium]
MEDLVRLVVLKTWEVTVRMAPYILFGYLMAGILRLFLSVDKVRRYLGEDNPLAVLWAALLGVPLPLCSCGILPVAASLRSGGASRGAVASFLLSTPQTGVDNIIATYGMMGWAFALWRPVQAFLMGLLGGTLIDLFDKEAPAGGTEEPSCCCEKEKAPEPSCCEKEKAPETSCCCEKEKAPEPSCCCEKEKEPEPSCCCEKEKEPEPSCCCEKEKTSEPSCCCGEVKKQHPAAAALLYAFRDLPGEIGGHLLLGLVLAGVFSALCDPGSFRHAFGGLFGQIGICVLLGLPMYVCSTASIPLAFSLVAAGFEPGAALVFMVTGPETNLAAFPVLSRLLGGKGLCIYLATVIITACLCGILLNGFLSLSGGAGEACHESSPSALWGALLLAVLFMGVIRKYTRAD